MARYVQECLCLPSDKDMAETIEKGGIQECGIDRRHIKIANIIYGPARAAVEGKTVQRKNKMPRDSSMLLGIPQVSSKDMDMCHWALMCYTLTNAPM